MTKTDMTRGLFGWCVATALIGGLAATGAQAKTDDGAASAAAAQAAETAGAEPEDSDKQITRQGLKVEFLARPLLGALDDEDRDIVELDYTSISFRVTDTATGQPVGGLLPGSWIDLVETDTGETTGALPCKDRIGLYLRGTTGVRPLIDINSYYILVLNEDATISVVDPNVLIAGQADMYFTQVILPRPGADWAQSADQKRVYVSMPRADTLGVVETDTFKLLTQVKTGSEPVRVAVQPDGRYVWVGNNAKGKMGGVTVIDTQTLEVAAQISTGTGHHEIAFSDDDRVAAVTNRTDGTVTFIDIQTLEKIKDLRVGAAPLAVVYSTLSKAFYIADGAGGVVHAIDGDSLEIVDRIQLKQGLGPSRVTADGRWILVTNAANDLVHVIDASANAVAHDVPIPGKPYQVSVTRAFAYVRALESERVSMINLAALGKGGMPPVVAFPLGDKAPTEATSLSIADTVVEAAGEAGVVAVDPAGNSLAYYMEGMNAPMGTFNSKGHNPRAVLVTDRALVENAPGTYAARIQVPMAGTFEVAFVLDSPPLLHCFRFSAVPNPALQRELKPLEIEYLVTDKMVPAGKPMTLRFRLVNPAAEKPASGLSDVRVVYYRSPGQGRRDLPAKEVGDGVYEATLDIGMRGTYFVYVASASSNAPMGFLNYLTLRAVSPQEGARPRAADAKE